MSTIPTQRYLLYEETREFAYSKWHKATCRYDVPILGSLGTEGFPLPSDRRPGCPRRSLSRSWGFLIARSIRRTADSCSVVYFPPRWEKTSRSTSTADVDMRNPRTANGSWGAIADCNRSGARLGGSRGLGCGRRLRAWQLLECGISYAAFRPSGAVRKPLSLREAPRAADLPWFVALLKCVDAGAASHGDGPGSSAPLGSKAAKESPHSTASSGLAAGRGSQSVVKKLSQNLKKG